VSVTRLVVGLGNPGERYQATRHNVGWRVLDAFAAAQGLGGWSVKQKLAAEVLAAGGLALVKPQTFMNQSGQAAGAVASYYKVPPERVLVVGDDFQLPLGTVRFRESGSSGGQKGLEDIIKHFGTSDVPRLRIGIGDPVGDPSDYVLKPFSKDQQSDLPGIITDAVNALTEWTTGAEQ